MVAEEGVMVAEEGVMAAKEALLVAAARFTRSRPLRPSGMAAAAVYSPCLVAVMKGLA